MTQPIHRNSKAGTWISWLGSPSQFLILGKETEDHYCISRGSSPTGGGAPPHSHDFEEGFFVLSGRLNFRAGKEVVELEAGDFINVGSGVAHSIENKSGEDAEVLIVCAPAGEEFLKEPQIQVTRGHEGVTVDAVGDRYRFLANHQHTNGNYSIWDAKLSPGGGPPPHIHRREEEGFFVLEGRIMFYSGDDSFTAGPGDFVHLPRNGLHWFRNETDEPARTLILVAPGGLEEMFLKTGVIVNDASSPLNPPTDEEKAKLVQVAPEFGIELRLPEH